MNTLSIKNLVAGAIAMGLFASAVSAQDTNPITYVDATHGAGGNTRMLDGSVWNPLEGDSAEGFWTTRPGFGNNGLVYQNAGGAFIQSNDAHPIVTSVSGLAEGVYDVFVYFWADQSPWRIRAALSEGDGDWPLFIARSEGVTQFYDGVDATVFSPSLEDDPFVASAANDGEGVMVGEGNRRLFQAYVGSFSGTEFSVFIDDGPAPGQTQRTWYDGVGYAPAVPRVINLPHVADFGTVRFLEVRDDIGAGQVTIDIAEEGGLPFIDEEITITSLPTQLAGKLVLRTANADATWLFDEEAVTVEWDYFDAIPDLDFGGNPRDGANTTLADGSGPFQPPSGTSGAADEWVIRTGFGNTVGSDPFVIQAFGSEEVGEPVNAPELKTTIRGLEPGASYPVAAMFWRDPSPWSIRAGLQYGNDLHENELYDMNHPAVMEASTMTWSTNVLVAEGNRFFLAAPLGQAVADENGEIDVFIHDAPTTNQAQRTWYDGVAIGSAPLRRDGTYLAFEVDRDTTVYVINDPASEPAWLTSTFSSTGMTVETTAGTFDVWERAVAARELVVLPGKSGDFEEMNYWVILGEGPDAITDNPEVQFMTLPAGDWSTGRFFRRAASWAGDPLHTASMTANASNFTPESGFRLSSSVRVPRLQDEGDNSIGFHLLGGNGEAIRAEWLPRASGGGSVLRFVDTSDESVLTQESWTGLAPTRTDNDVGISGGAVEIQFSAGTLIFVEDAESVVFSEDFETGGAGWAIGASNPALDQWEIGVPTSGPGNAFSGNNVAATNLAGHYTSGGIIDTVSWLRSPEIDLRGMGSATLRFHEYLDVDTLEINDELFHYAAVRVLDADTMGLIAQLTTYNHQILSWTERELDLSVGAGNQIILEFALYTDEVEDDVGDGWYIDAVEVTATGSEIVTLPEGLTLDGTLNGISTERAGVSDTSDSHLQFTVTDRGVSGNEGVTVYVAWDIRASGLEPDWLTQEFHRTDHFVQVSSAAGYHRLWAREYADGAEVTLGGASAAGPGAMGLPAGTDNYFVLLGDARPGLETLYTLEATGSWEGDDGTLTFSVTDANGVSQSVQTMVNGDVTSRNEFGLAVRHPDANGGAVVHAPVWEIFVFTLDGFDEIAPPEGSFQAWLEEYFLDDLDNPEVSGPEANPTGDGVANLVKYALGLDPWIAAAPGDLPQIVPDEEHILVLVYHERTDIDDVAYVPQVAEGLQATTTWLEGSPHVVEISRVPGPSANTQEVRVRGEVSQDAQTGFLRLTVRLVE